MRFTEDQYNDLKEEIRSWILRIDEEEMLPKGIKALNFGLIEPYGIELTGAKVYNSEDDDWCFQEDFIPEERECPGIEIDEVIAPDYLKKTVVLILKEILPELKDLDLLKVQHITTGFREKDLVEIK